jgi:L-ascorbate metabolism protein UlaG (beta-lactamase superfamily)
MRSLETGPGASLPSVQFLIRSTAIVYHPRHRVDVTFRETSIYMRQLIVVALLLSLVAQVQPLAAQVESAPDPATAGDAGGVEITYIANEGFLLVGEDRGVLVDALFDVGVRGYPRVPEEIRRGLEGSSGRFQDVRLILASHYHADHFAAGPVARALENNTAAILISTEQAADGVRQVIPEMSTIAARVIGLFPPQGKSQTVTVAGIRVEVFNLHHGRDRPEIQNLGFLLEIDGVKILHIGDTEATAEEFAPYGLAGEAIDVALLPYWYLLHPKWQAVVRDSLRPKQIVAMHLPVAEAAGSYFHPGDDLPGLLAAIDAAFPGTLAPTRPLETMSFRAEAE